MSSLRNDLLGQTFGRLLVLRRAERGPNRKARWHVRCECGTEREVDAYKLISGHTRSCGCMNARRTHGQNGSRLNKVWRQMIQRCTNQRNDAYKNYGGRGIYVCDKWRDFAAFFADMGERPTAKHTLERIDNDGPYSPENCRWATRAEQNRNHRRNKLVPTPDGSRQVLADAAVSHGLQPNTVRSRVRRGWPLESALVAPKRRGHRPSFVA